MSSDDDQEVFEITDFTTVSEWERFIAQIEEVIHEGKLSNTTNKIPLTKEALSNGVWLKKTENLNFLTYNFNIHRIWLKQNGIAEESTRNDEEESETLPTALMDMMCPSCDFFLGGPFLSQWFGLREYLMIEANFDEGIGNETRAKLLLSSIAVALNNTNCQIPMFVRVKKKQEHYFLGICEGGNVRTNFDMVYLRRVPSKYNHLSGLVDVFNSKIAVPSMHESPDITVSIKFTYSLNDWSNFSWPQSPPDMDLFMGEVGVSKFGELPCGAYEDPISTLLLQTVWTALPEKSVSDNSVFSVLTPLNAPFWSACLLMKPKLQCLLFEYLSDFKTICSCKETSASILGHEIEESDPVQGAKITQTLNRLAKPVKIPSISSVVSKTRIRAQTTQENVPIPTQLLIRILQFIFPDAVSETSSDVSRDDLSFEFDDDSPLSLLREQLKGLKSAPSSSLATRLALAMCHINHSYGGLTGVAHMWQEFVIEMRYRWENYITLPCMEGALPNFRYCLLYQKLQMLNCCISRKINYQEQSVRSETPSKSSSAKSIDSDCDTDNDEDLIFYECDDEVEQNVKDGEDGAKGGKQIQKGGLNEPRSSKTSTMTQPEGRLKKCGNLKLINSDVPLYIPITQEPAPMTEDLLEAQANILMHLGTDQEAAHLRAKMQSACLLSDMESFKAANPDAGLEDFIRWYSPRDWIEEKVVDEVTGDTKIEGHFSSRMMLPQNMWKEVWESAKSIPARKQKRLFDETKEAEKVLHYLTSMTPAEVALNLFPMLIHSSLLTIMKKCDIQFKPLASLIEATITKAIKVTRSQSQNNSLYEELIKDLGTAETLIAQIQSLKSKFRRESSTASEDELQILEEKEEPEIEDKVKEDYESTQTDYDEFDSFLYKILEGKEIEVPDTCHSSVGKTITSLFTEAYKAANMISDEDSSKFGVGRNNKFPAPIQREYIIRTISARPTIYSTPTPQRMHCILNNSFRIASAFSEDTVFQ